MTFSPAIKMFPFNNGFPRHSSWVVGARHKNDINLEVMTVKFNHF